VNASGAAPQRSKAAIVKRRRASALSARALAQWVDDGSLDGIDFDRDVAPKLGAIGTPALARLLGCSKSWASMMSNGRAPVHRHFWATILGT
jgi:hypothetical protein